MWEHQLLQQNHRELERNQKKTHYKLCVEGKCEQTKCFSCFLFRSQYKIRLRKNIQCRVFFCFVLLSQCLGRFSVQRKLLFLVVFVIWWCDQWDLKGTLDRETDTQREWENKTHAVKQMNVLIWQAHLVLTKSMSRLFHFF